MTHTKKRILAMLLAVVLMFSSLPFSVSADEVSSELPTESTVESQPKESQAEETEESHPRQRMPSSFRTALGMCRCFTRRTPSTR